MKIQINIEDTKKGFEADLKKFAEVSNEFVELHDKIFDHISETITRSYDRNISLEEQKQDLEDFSDDELNVLFTSTLVLLNNYVAVDKLVKREDFIRKSFLIHEYLVQGIDDAKGKEECMKNLEFFRENLSRFLDDENSPVVSRDFTNASGTLINMFARVEKTLGEKINNPLTPEELVELNDISVNSINTVIVFSEIRNNKTFLMYAFATMQAYIDNMKKGDKRRKFVKRMIDFKDFFKDQLDFSNYPELKE